MVDCIAFSSNRTAAHQNALLSKCHDLYYRYHLLHLQIQQDSMWCLLLYVDNYVVLL